MNNRLFFVFLFCSMMFGASGILTATSVLAKPAAPVTKLTATRLSATKVVIPAIGGGNVNLPCNITPRSITINDDGSTVIALDREIGGGHRLRQNLISADGVTFFLDGVQVISPPAAMTALGGVVSQLQTRFTAAYSTPGMSALLCAP